MDRPGVYALVVGCTYQGDGVATEGQSPLAQAADSVHTFSEMLIDAYGDDLHLALMLDTGWEEAIVPPLAVPTLQSVTRFLQSRVPRVPPNSLVVFYFAGHGTRPPLNPFRPHVKGDLHLLLQGSRGVEPAGHSVRIQEVLSALARCHRATYMILLDCCSSGRSPADERIPAIDKLEHRGFMLGATSSDSIAFSGRLAKALQEVLGAFEGGFDCRLPIDLWRELGDYYRSEGIYYTPDLWFGGSVQQCITDLRHDATLLVFVFPKGLAQCNTIVFSADGGDIWEFKFSFAHISGGAESVALAIRVPTSRHITAEFRSSGGIPVQELAFNRALLASRGFHLVPVVPDEERYRSVANIDAFAEGLEDAVGTVIAYGEADSTAYFDAACIAAQYGDEEMPQRIAARALDRVASLDLREILDSVQDIEPWQEPLVKSASGELAAWSATADAYVNATVRLDEATLDRLAIHLGVEDPGVAAELLVRRLDRDQLDEILDYLESTNQVHAAARVAHSAAKRVDLWRDRPALLTRAMENSVAAHDIAELLTVAETLAEAKASPAREWMVGQIDESGYDDAGERWRECMLAAVEDERFSQSDITQLFEVRALHPAQSPRHDQLPNWHLTVEGALAIELPLLRFSDTGVTPCFAGPLVSGGAADAVYDVRGLDTAWVGRVRLAIEERSAHEAAASDERAATEQRMRTGFAPGERCQVGSRLKADGLYYFAWRGDGERKEFLAENPDAAIRLRLLDWDIAVRRAATSDMLNQNSADVGSD